MKRRVRDSYESIRDFRIGIIGGGQLGKMLAIEAAKLGLRVKIYDPGKDCPAASVSEELVVGEFDDEKKLLSFAKKVDVITFEFENIPSESLMNLEKLVPVYPSSKVLHISQNRIREKDFARSVGVMTPKYERVSGVQDLQLAAQIVGLPGILKTCELGYDGKGQYSLENMKEVSEFQSKFAKAKNFPEMVLEEYVSYAKEISVIVARNQSGEMINFPIAENKHKSGILDTTTIPARISEEVAEKARLAANRIAAGLEVVGLLCVEFFVTDKDEVIFNEMAPRPHNSGHWTFSACTTSQFEQLIRVVSDLPFGAVDILSPCIMHNLIGHDVENLSELFSHPHIQIHLYGKTTVKDGRKMGHYIEFLKN